MPKDDVQRINSLIWWFLLPAFIFLFPLNSFAADTICGVDTDENGTYSLACTGISDADRDGVITSLDCDDSNRFIITGTLKDFSGTLMVCAANGSWTTVGAWPSGVLAAKATLGADDVKFVGPAGSTTDNTCGASGNPCDYRCFSTGNGLGCSQTLSAGTWVIFLTGNYTGFYTATTRKQVFLNNIDGTAGHEIRFVGVIGQAATITGQGTAGSPVYMMKFDDSNYVIVQNLEATGGVGISAIGVAGGTNTQILTNHVHDFENFQNDNHAGISISNDATGSIVRGNVVHDIVYTAGSAGEKQHSNQILIMDVNSYVVDYNVVYCDGTDCRGIIDKHAAGGATVKEMIGNVSYGMLYQGMVGASRHLRMKNNYIANSGTGFEVLNIGGGDQEFGDIVIQNNTVNGTFPLIFNPEGSFPAGETYALQILDNIFIDDKASAYNGNDGFFRVCHYCDDTLYTAFSGKLNFDNNGVYNNQGQALYETLWGDVGSGASGVIYTTCAPMVAGPPAHANTPCATSAGTDPALNSMQVATTTGLTDAGWNVNWPGSGGATTTTTVATTTTSSTIITTTITTTTSVIPASVGGALPAIV